MSTQRRPQLFARKMHDAWRNLLGVLRVPLRKRDIATAAGAEDLGEVQAAGESLLDNSLEADFHGLAERTLRRAWPAAHLYRIRNAAVVGDSGHVFLQDGTFLATRPNAYTEPDRKIRRPIRLGAKRVEGPVLHLMGVAHQSRAHFVLQVMPGLLAAGRVLEQRPDMRVLVTGGQRGWQCGFLERLGIPAEQVVENTPGTTLVEELYYIPPMFGPDHLCAPGAYEALGAMWPAAAGAERRSVLFISRRDAPVRRLENEDAIFEITRDVLGAVERVELAGMPQEEQARRFQSARWIIGAHGQGFFNAVFSSRALLVDLNECAALPGAGTWQEAYHNLVLMRGGRAVRFFTGQPQIQNADWCFPADEYRRQLARLVRLAGD